MRASRLSLNSLFFPYDSVKCSTGSIPHFKSSFIRRKECVLAHRFASTTLRHESTKFYKNAPRESPKISKPSTLERSFKLQRPAEKLRRYTPKTPGLRHLIRPINDHLWKGKPYRPLTFPKKGQARAGRNNTGRITVRHRGGGHKRRIRTVDFRRSDPGLCTVNRIEYDPNRSAHIALIERQETEEKSYILAPEGLAAGDVIQSFMQGIPRELMDEMGGVVDPSIFISRAVVRGNCLPVYMIPIGTQIFNVGSRPLDRGVFCRGAGTYASIVTKDYLLSPRSPEQSSQEGEQSMSSGLIPHDEKSRKWLETQFVTVKLQSGEIRRVSAMACATIGIASNPQWQFRQLGKAGRSRRLGIRPTVRGMAMNAVDHPHGGGRGKSKGNRDPVSPWGKPAKSGFKTRRAKKVNRWVVKERPRNHGKQRNVR